MDYLSGLDFIAPGLGSMKNNGQRSDLIIHITVDWAGIPISAVETLMEVRSIILTIFRVCYC